jgi:hypothetical protein
MALGGGTDQSASDASQVIDPALLGAINGAPSTGANSFYPVPDGSGGFMAAPDTTSGFDVGSFFSSVPSWVWYIVGGVVLLRIVRR